MSVERGKHAIFELEFTVPFGCIHDDRRGYLDDCIIAIEMEYNNDMQECQQPVGVLGLSHACSRIVKGYTRLQYQNGETWKPRIYWNVSNTDDKLFPYKEYYTNRYKLRLKTLSAESIYHFWNNYHIADIDVSI